MNRSTVFTYDNGTKQIHFAYTRDFWISSLSGASSVSVTVTDGQSVGQIGTTISNKSVQPKNITINGVLLGSVEENRRLLLDCIVPQVEARLTVEQNGKSYYIIGTPTKTPEIEDGEGLQNFQFVFYCPYPYWRTTKAETVQVASLTPLFRFPFYTGGTWKLSEFSGDAYKNIVNTGNVPIEFTAQFSCRSPVTNPELYHITSASFIRLGTDADPFVLNPGEIVIVSTITGQRGAKLTKEGATQNAFRFLDEESDLGMKIEVGDNLFRAWASDNKAGLSINISAPEGVVTGV